MLHIARLACLLLALSAAAPAGADDRLALVIGNAGYRNVPALANPVNDARLMARTLRETGFEVTMVVEADRAAMERAVERFGQAVRGARPGTLALFHFAGHGVRNDGFNYLLPLGIDIQSEADIAREAVSAEWVQARIQAPGVTSVMVLDACRNNPFGGRTDGSISDLGDGLARMTAGEDSLIAYATGPGEVAFDGIGGNSPYTAALARAIRTPGLDVEEIFEQVREEVETATAGAQIPWARFSLDSGVYIQSVPGGAAASRSDASSMEAPVMDLQISFRPGRWNGDSSVCRTRYRFGSVRLPVAPGDTRRVSALNGDRGLELELSAASGADAADLRILPVSKGSTGRPIMIDPAEIGTGDVRTLPTRSRHPDYFGCGPMTIYLSRNG